MIIVKSIETSNTRGRTVTLFADLKSEVPQTGIATSALINEGVKLNPGDIVYTSGLDIAILDTNDEWNWSE